jgi:putative ABC transport system permease protein
MLVLALRELISRRTATLLAGAGLLTATLGFMILASTSLTTEATLKGDVNRAWAAPYDLLIRPPGSATPLENSEGLVRPNFLSSGAGGITMQQLDAVRQVPGVAVAAPIAILGYTYWPSSFPLDLSSIVDPAQPIQAFRLRITASADAGMSSIPFTPTPYQLVAPQGTLHARSAQVGVVTNLTFPGGQVDCSSLAFTDSCWGPTIDCPGCQSVAIPVGAYGKAPGWVEAFSQPLLLAGIDPGAEAMLTGLDRCVTQGSYLTPGPIQIKPRATTSGVSLSQAVIPTLVSTTSFVDETFHIEVDQSSQASLLINGGTPEQLGGWVPVLTKDVTAQSVFKVAVGTSPYGAGTLFIRPGDVTYDQTGPDHLTATTQTPDLNVYDNPLIAAPLEVQLPAEALDNWFRPLTQAHWNNTSNAILPIAGWNPVGSYDPTCIPGFNQLGAGELQTYAPPQVTLPNRKTLLPTRSAAGYVNSPPLLLTTLQAAQFFSDPLQFPGGLGDKFISAIRVRVTGVSTPGPISQARLSRVAGAIRDATGLSVDIIRGSSPRSIQVDLPAGKFGRPSLTVTEPWAVKGVAFKFLRAVSAQNLALFGLVLLGGMVLVGETGYISVVRRRREFGVLRALGWRTSSIAWLVELEMLTLGLVVGVLAIALGLPIMLRLGLGSSAWQLGAVVPLAVGIAALAGIIPALAAARGSVVAMIESTGRATITNRPLPSCVIGIAWRELRGQWRAEAALGAFAIALGAATLGVLVLISTAFRGQLDTTVLGTYLAGEVRPFHLVLAGLTLVVGAIAAAEVVTLSYLERRSHLGALRALGWPASAVLRFLVAQASVLGLGGGLAAVVVVVAAGLVLQAPLSAIGWGLLAALGMTFLATAIAVMAPLAHAYRANPADSLRGE